MSRLADHFDLTLVISLPERQDRREALLRNLNDTGIAREDEIEWLPACRAGHAGGPPEGWTACKPAWGCLQSHLMALDLAMDRGVRSLCILEDDVHFSRHAPQMLRVFMDAVPADWAQVYLGGHHTLAPRPTEHPLVWKAGGVITTHAYAVAGEALPAVRRDLGELTDYLRFEGWHCDSHFALCHARERWPAYTPTWWMAAQEEGRSNISGRDLARRWLHPRSYAMELPFVLVDDPAALSPEEQAAAYHHAAPVPSSIPALLDWMFSAASRAIAYNQVPILTRATAPGEEILRQLWPAGILAAGEADLPALADYPFNGLFSHPLAAALHPTPNSLTYA